MVAPHALDAFLAFTRREGGEIVYSAATATPEDRKGLPPAYELAWNHTTLRALRVDPSITYLQVLYPYPNQVELVYSEVITGATTLTIPYQDPAIRSSAGGFVADTLYLMAA